MTRLVKLAAFAAASVLMAALVGCSERRAKVSGTVTFNNKPVPGGMVFFVAEDGIKSDTAEIGSDGTYVTSSAPIGTVKVGVQPAQKGAAAYMPKGAKKPAISDPGVAAVYGKTGTEYVDIPTHLRDPKTSKITVVLEAGVDKTFDINLPSK